MKWASANWAARRIFLSASEAQLGRGEPIKDTARVLARMIHGAVIRTYAQQDVEEFAQFSALPTINALTDQEHPCQILTDIFTFQEKRGPIEGKRVVFVGDGACNVPSSWMFAAGKLGFELRIAAPRKFQPSAELLRRAGGTVVCTEDVRAAPRRAPTCFTPTCGCRWARKPSPPSALRELAGYQINEDAGQTGPARTRWSCTACRPIAARRLTKRPSKRNAETIFDQAATGCTARRPF